MSTENDAIRRQLGMDMPHEPRNMAEERFTVRRIEPVAIAPTRPDLLPAGTLYFTSFDDFEAWYDSEDGTID